MALVVVPAPGMASAAGTSKNVTFQLVEKQQGVNFVDNPPRQGYRHFAFTSNLTAKSESHAGVLDVSCTITRGGIHATGPCSGVFSFKGGQLMGMARVAFSKAVTEVAIVGDTGVYRGAQPDFGVRLEGESGAGLRCPPPRAQTGERGLKPGVARARRSRSAQRVERIREVRAAVGATGEGHGEE
jgi:hypothetical protein